MQDATDSLSENIRRAMRSFHRLIELKSMGSPDTLITAELRLLMKYFAILNAEELVFIMKGFATYHETERKQDALATEEFFKEAKRYFGSLN